MCFVHTYSHNIYQINSIITKNLLVCVNSKTLVSDLNGTCWHECLFQNGDELAAEKMKCLLTFFLFLNLIVLSFVECKISDQRLCVDAECSGKIAYNIFHNLVQD